MTDARAMLETVLVALTIATTNQNSILETKPVTQEVQPPPKELTLEEKIKTNFYKCNTDTQWIRKDNAQCLPKKTPEPPRTARPVVAGNTYYRGYCTYYVKNTLSWVPNGLGDANTWAVRARAMGYTVSNTPVVGAVAQSSAGAEGHVAVVIGVGNGTVVISEMNYVGWNRVSTRTVPTSTFVYIY